MMKTSQFALPCGLLLLLATARAGASVLVLGGSDFLASLPGTVFAGVPFEGVPEGPGDADTVVLRTGDADVTLGTDSVPVQLVSLQLKSSAPTDFGLGLDFYYITLQSIRGGPASAGSMTIQFTAPDDHLPNTPEGTFSSFFDVFFDIRKGALDGPIALSDSLTLTNQGTPWDADPDSDDLVVPGLTGDLGANLHTDKVQGPGQYEMDFFPLGPFQETHPTGAVHRVTTASPEPSSGVLALGGGALALLARRRRSPRPPG